jgi:hypothetical protein
MLIPGTPPWPCMPTELGNTRGIPAIWGENFKGQLAAPRRPAPTCSAKSRPICAALGLTALRCFCRTLSKLNLSGTIPEGWVAPMALFSLALSSNSLSGTLPNSWVLPKCCLSYLDLSQNSFKGPFPQGLAGLAQLR